MTSTGWTARQTARRTHEQLWGHNTAQHSWWNWIIFSWTRNIASINRTQKKTHQPNNNKNNTSTARREQQTHRTTAPPPPPPTTTTTTVRLQASKPSVNQTSSRQSSFTTFTVLISKLTTMTTTTYNYSVNNCVDLLSNHHLSVWTWKQEVVTRWCHHCGLRFMVTSIVHPTATTVLYHALRLLSSITLFKDTIRTWLKQSWCIHQYTWWRRKTMLLLSE